MPKKIKMLIWNRVRKYFVLLNDLSEKALVKHQLDNLADCGKNVRICKNCFFTLSNVHVGDNVYIGANCDFIASVAHIYIGNHVMFGPSVTIRGGDHRIDIIGKYMIDITEDEKKPENDKDVIIEDDVWVGTNVTILKGVKIGRGSIVGAGSIVTKDIPPYTVHVGSHGILERPRFTKEQIIEHERLLKENYKDNKVD